MVNQSKLKKYIPRNIRETVFGAVGHCMATFVITPKVPSDPINKWWRAYPVLSFLRQFRASTTVPSALTLKYFLVEIFLLYIFCRLERDKKY